MQDDDVYLAFLKAQDYLTSTEGVIEGLERLANFLNEEGWYSKANYVDRAINKIKELSGEPTSS